MFIFNTQTFILSHLTRHLIKANKLSHFFPPFECSQTPFFQAGGGQNLERRNLDRPIFRNFKIAKIKITQDELFDDLIFHFLEII